MNEHGTDADDTPGTKDAAADARTVELLRSGVVVEAAPPAHVWASIVRALGHPREGTSEVHAISRSGVHELPASRRARHGGRTGAGSWGGGAGRLLAAAAVGALVAWAGITLADRDPASQVLASGQLQPLTEAGTEGSAEVVEVDGHQRLRVQLSTVPDGGDGYLEVWLLRPDVSGMVTLGVLDGDQGEFLLPEGIDLGEYAVVDISREHMDGDPGHGGDSLVRGEVG